jgi:hypothetical protein
MIDHVEARIWEGTPFAATIKVIYSEWDEVWYSEAAFDEPAFNPRHLADQPKAMQYWQGPTGASGQVAINRATVFHEDLVALIKEGCNAGEDW